MCNNLCGSASAEAKTCPADGRPLQLIKADAKDGLGARYGCSECDQVFIWDITFGLLLEEGISRAEYVRAM